MGYNKKDQKCVEKCREIMTSRIIYIRITVERNAFNITLRGLLKIG